MKPYSGVGPSPCGNKKNWRWFLAAIRRHFPGFQAEDSAFISDRDKGLLPAVDRVFPHTPHAYCCWHLAENIGLRWPRSSCKRLFWSAAYAKTEQKYLDAMEKIKIVSVDCHSYLES